MSKQNKHFFIIIDSLVTAPFVVFKCQIQISEFAVTTPHLGCESKRPSLSLYPPSSGRRHSPSTDASVIMAALDGAAPLNVRGE
jgi:hypothetical protein